MELSGIDFFAGAGGFSLAAQRAGVRIRAAVEIDKHACTTYRENLIKNVPQPAHLEEGDIATISWPKFLKEAQLQAGDCDIVIGGPPCQGFSAHRINGAGVDDPRNSLLLRYFDCIRAVKPLSFIVENVAGLLWPRHKNYLDNFLRLADEAGYEILGPTTLNARDFGVPQNRKRVFIVGKRKGLHLKIKWPPVPTHFDPASDEVRIKHKASWKTAETVFAKSLRQDDPNNRHMQSGAELVKIFKSTPLNGGSRADSCRVLACHDAHDGHKDVYGRIDPKRPGPTMTTACINPSKGRFLHPTEHHGITLRHAARFQSFPEKYVFHGGLIAAGKQIGNAVPITLGKVVVRSVAEALKSSRIEKEAASERT